MMPEGSDAVRQWPSDPPVFDQEVRIPMPPTMSTRFARRNGEHAAGGSSYANAEIVSADCPGSAVLPATDKTAAVSCKSVDRPPASEAL
jgi:hypothetical protein